MKIILATGIYPPAIGGPATYVRALAEELVEKGMEVVVITYCVQDANVQDSKTPINFQNLNPKIQVSEDAQWNVVQVEMHGGPLLRWIRYARTLKRVGHDVDAVIAFSSVSAGVPLWMSRLKMPFDKTQTQPKLYLRLGGDFLWERYTDGGGERGLRDFYTSLEKFSIFNFQFCIAKWFMYRLLNTFTHIVFSTRFQEEIYEEHYHRLPPHSVIENAVPSGEPIEHERGPSLRLLFMGRFVGFKNLFALLRALAIQHHTPLRGKPALTFIGDGPLKGQLELLCNELGIHRSVRFLPPVHGDVKKEAFRGHDLLVLPSITEISPNVALEARAYGLPVLLSSETGLSPRLSGGMMLRNLRTPEEIASALQEAHHLYPQLARDAAENPLHRSWKEVASEWEGLLSSR